MLQVVRPVELLGYALQGLSQGMAMLDKMMALFHEAPEPQLPEAEAAVLPATGVAISALGSVSPLPGGRNDYCAPSGELEFRDVHLAYDPDRPLLQGVSFKVSAGQTLALVGASGSGKSTVVRLAVRFIAADRGQILLDGDPIASMSLRALRQAIAVVPQETHLFDESLGYNIGLGKQGATQEDIEQAAKQAHLHNFILSLPEQYNTRVGERGVKLSGGERQRLAIARAIIKRPRIFILDEPTSSLDSVTENGIIGNLRDLARFSTTLVIAHRLSTVVYADEIAVLERGTIVESGTHAALLRRGGQYATLWRAQQRNVA
jgi:ATP-binding cassette subfamily B protein